MIMERYLILKLFFSIALGKMEIVLDEKLEKCVDAKDDAGFYDMSEFEIVAESDTKVFLNGSIKFLRNVEAPWSVHIFAEKFNRGQWNVYAIDKTVPDFCSVMHRPSEPWYLYLKDFGGCPIKAGVSYK